MEIVTKKSRFNCRKITKTLPSNLIPFKGNYFLSRLFQELFYKAHPMKPCKLFAIAAPCTKFAKKLFFRFWTQKMSFPLNVSAHLRPHLTSLLASTEAETEVTKFNKFTPMTGVWPKNIFCKKWLDSSQNFRNQISKIFLLRLKFS